MWLNSATGTVDTQERFWFCPARLCAAKSCGAVVYLSEPLVSWHAFCRGGHIGSWLGGTSGHSEFLLFVSAKGRRATHSGSLHLLTGPTTWFFPIWINIGLFLEHTLFCIFLSGDTYMGNMNVRLVLGPSISWHRALCYLSSAVMEIRALANGPQWWDSWVKACSLRQQTRLYVIPISAVVHPPNPHVHILSLNSRPGL